MTHHLVPIIPAVRILASKNTLLLAQSVAQGNGIIDSEKKLRDQGICHESQSVLNIREAGIDFLKKAFEDWYIRHTEHPDFVAVKDLGSIALSIPVKRPDRTLTGKIAVITGAAQGFGAGIAEGLFNLGANIIIADINAEIGTNMEKRLNEGNTENKSLFVKTDVSDPGSVETMVEQTVLQFGGIDIMISNAGILHAGGLDEMTPEIFQRMTNVNYTGFFYCAKYASQIMKILTSCDEHYFCDILQINSKSGLQGSNRNFAYAGGKFGGIGLTESLALELMKDHIKVNAICPGNFFEGPLWSDPEKGLFVQYLKTGKVPGAKTIEDVRKHYEKRVPAGRGCRVEDVLKAVLYAIDQQYETGQAIPVTGGQIMLH